jgi:hypothetical protein
MAWYDDKKCMTYVGTYKTEKDMQQDVERAAKQGFLTQPQDAGSLTMTFVRDPLWEPTQRLFEALKPLDGLQRKLSSGEEETSGCRSAVEGKLREVIAGPQAGQSGVESELVKTTKRLIGSREQTQKRASEFLGALDAALAAHEHAVSVGVVAEPIPYDPGLAQKMRKDAEASSAHLAAEQQFLSVQQALADASQQRAKAEEQRTHCANRLRDAETRLTETSSKLEAAKAAATAAEASGAPVPEAPKGFFSFLRKTYTPAEQVVRAQSDFDKAQAGVAAAHTELDRAAADLAAKETALSPLIAQRAEVAKALLKA